MRLHDNQENPPDVNIWQCGVTRRAHPFLDSIRPARVVPGAGSDTLLANLEAAYEGLNNETRKPLDGLIAIHDEEPFRARMTPRGASEEAPAATRAEFPPIATGSLAADRRVGPASGRCRRGASASGHTGLRRGDAPIR